MAGYARQTCWAADASRCVPVPRHCCHDSKPAPEAKRAAAYDLQTPVAAHARSRRRHRGVSSVLEGVRERAAVVTRAEWCGLVAARVRSPPSLLHGILRVSLGVKVEVVASGPLLAVVIVVGTDGGRCREAPPQCSDEEVRLTRPKSPAARQILRRQPSTQVSVPPDASSSALSGRATRRAGPPKRDKFEIGLFVLRADEAEFNVRCASPGVTNVLRPAVRSLVSSRLLYCFMSAHYYVSTYS